MIYTFYSYKGGAGRTHLLANIASYLCYYKKRKILLIDWDLEAPGLHYYFDKKEEDLQHTKGLIDLCEHYISQVSKATKEKPLEGKDLFFPNEDYIYNLITAKNGGKIDLLPATQYTEGYHSHINQFDWIDFYDTQKGSIYLTWLKKQLKSSKYDYVFIDSRTGQNDYSGICNVLMPDLNVLVVAPNTQNFEGAKKMADRIINSKYVKENKRKPYILPILSKLDEGNSGSEGEKWKNKFVDTFKFCIPLLDKNLENFSQEIADVFFEHTYQPYNPDIALGEHICFNEETLILRETNPFKRLENIALDFIEEMNETNEIDMNKVVGDRMKIVYKKITNTNPNNYKIWFLLGNVYREEENHKKAKECFIEAIRIKPDFEIAWFSLGNIYLNEENIEKAKEAFQKAVGINPNFEDAWTLLGGVYQIETNIEKAKEAFQKAIEINQNFEGAWFMLGTIYKEENNIEKAKEAFQKTIEINPNSENAWFILGTIYQDENNIEKVKEMLQKVIEINPNFERAWLLLGLIYQDENNIEKAKEAFRMGTEINPNFESTWALLGGIYFNENNYEEAIKYFQKALEINPNFKEALNGLGVTYNYQGEYTKAKEIFECLIRENPSNADFIFNLACVCSLEKNKEQALIHLQKATILDAKYKQEVQSDTDFEWLWEDVDFKKMVE